MSASSLGVEKKSSTLMEGPEYLTTAAVLSVVRKEEIGFANFSLRVV